MWQRMAPPSPRFVPDLDALGATDLLVARAADDLASDVAAEALFLTAWRLWRSRLAAPLE